MTLLMTSVCSALGTVLDKEIKTVNTDFVAVSKLKSNDLKLDEIIVDYSGNGDVLDQQQPTSCGHAYSITNQQWLAQSFKPSLEVLTRVKLWIFKAGNPPDDEEITVSIRENLDESDKVTLSIDASPISNQWVEFDFTDMVLTPDDTYYIVVRANGGDVVNCYSWVFDINNPYERGEGWFSIDGGSNWYLADTPDWPESDCCFKTYGYDRNQPPNIPSNPSPENHATEVDINADLSWTGGDPDESDTVIYDIYFGDVDPPPVEKSGHPDASYNPGTMEPSTTYYWYIIASDNHNATRIGPLWDFTTTAEDVNQPPNKPTITGPTSGKAGDPYTYSASATDPDGDEVFFWFDWDDGDEVGWLGKYSSGEICNLSHVWQAEGNYSIKVKAKDTNDLESGWTSLSISMPKNKISTLFQRFINKIPGFFSLLKQLFFFFDNS